MKNIKWFILILFYLAVLVGLYINDSNKYIEKISSQYIHQDYVIGSIDYDTTVGQTFIAKDDSISSISLMFATYNRENFGKVIFHLKDSKDSTSDIVKKSIDMRDLRDNSMYNISFPEVKVQRGKSYYFYIESPETLYGDSVTLWYNSLDYPKGTELDVNGTFRYGSLRYIIYHKEYKGLSIL